MPPITIREKYTLRNIFMLLCGVYRTRTDYLLIANQMLYQMS